MAQQHDIIIPQEVFDWYDEYAHGDIDRRTFLKRLGTLTGLAAGVSTGMISAALIPNYALAEQVSFNDEDITARYIAFDSPEGLGEVGGYLVMPTVDGKPIDQTDKKAPVVLVVHENRGLNPYIEDVARRLAKVGYIAFAPDILHTLGGYPGNDDEGRAMQRTLDKDKVEKDFVAAAAYLKAHSSSSGKLGVVGFCFGGYISNMLAATAPELVDAAAPFYGTPPKTSITAMTAPLMLHFGELDQRVNKTWVDYEPALKAAGVNYTAFVYPGTNHGFHNDSTSRYDEAAAELAWERTLGFFNTHLS